MSLIEDAARRLEELRRAGVELPDDVAASPKPVKPNGETPLPEAVTQDYHLVFAVLKIIRQECPAQSRGHAEQRKHFFAQV